MLDQLVESKNNTRENKSRGGILLTTSVLVVGLCFSAVVWSLFAKDLKMGSESFELSNLGAPIPIPEKAPPAQIEKQAKPEQSQKMKSFEITRQTNMARIDEPQSAPDKISVTPNTQKSRPQGFFKFSNGPETEGQVFYSNSKDGRAGNETAVGLSDQPLQVENTEKTKLPPPPQMKKPLVEPIAKTKTIVVSRGVVNGKATYLPKPVYLAAARAVKAGGEVSVQVTIDETGNVVSAKAVNGHPLLKTEAEKAARNAKFSPTFLSEQAVKVSGIIIYKFSMN
ncbi:MAG: energy transducer TonB [Acidobacteria bacterium]|nr:energy transducer TonB [Acidobacteriota bacterium]MCA1638247.1 energy transducer TonB [Acidobacteriota bacterium]